MTQPATPGAPPTQSASQLIRATDGKMRVDLPGQSIITNPMAQQAAILDHAKQTAQLVPIVNAPQMPGVQMPGMPTAPGMPAPPAMPAVQAQNLGKALIEGHEVEGMKYVMQPPAPPPVPALPAKPALPGMPSPPAAPAPPAPPPSPWSPRFGAARL